MLLIDRYLLRQFVWVFLVCFCSLAGLYIVADALGNLEEFLSHAEKSGDLIGTLTAYYGYRTISFFDRTSGVLALIAAMFTIAWLQRHNEMTALLAAGVSKRRIILPIVIAVALVSVLAAINREIITPRFRDKFTRNAQDLADDSARRLEPRYDNHTGILIRGRQLLTNHQTIQEPNFILPRDLSAHGRYLVAAAAIYQPAEGDRPSGFLFQNVSQPRDITAKPSLVLTGGEPAVITPHDAPWLKPNECYVVSGVEFGQLLDAASWRQYSSTWDLIQGLYNRSLDFGADVRVTIHSRLVQPVLDVALLFLGVPLVLRQANRNVFVAIGLCIGVVILFLLVVTGCHYLGTSILISPVMAVWAPLFLFVPLAVWMAEPIVE
jgi:lipopolysaccharide export system permease protein